MSATSIQWTDAVWNPIRGCSRVSPGCQNCYAERMAARFSADMWDGPQDAVAVMTKAGPRWTGKVILVEDKLNDPLHWKQPRRVFVNSMSDLFHERVKTKWLIKIFEVMVCANRHTFQVLTKRPERMLAFMSKYPGYAVGNIWLGVSAENQETADERIPLLFQTPAAVRWVSAEPLLGPIDLRPYLEGYQKGKPALDWVVVGGESGPGARKCDVARWLDPIVTACKEAGVSCFVKQMGANAWFGDGRLRFKDPKGGDPTQWAEHHKVRQLPHFPVRVE